MIEVAGLRKSFAAGGQTIAAVDGVDFSIKAGAMATLLGPSGCGKTTTLRCLAGLERPDSGRIAIGGATMVDTGVFVPPQRRNLGKGRRGAKCEVLSTALVPSLPFRHGRT